ncbi:MAG: acyloxyacyl hydrolase, partial [Planctomycetota bacterium]
KHFGGTFEVGPADTRTSLLHRGGGSHPSAVLARLGMAVPATIAAGQDQVSEVVDDQAPDARAGIDDLQPWDGTDPPPDADLESEDGFAAYGSAGSWWKTWFAAAAVASRRDGEQYHLGWEANYFVAEDFSMNFGISGIFFDQPERETTNDAVGGNFTLLFRWHFFVRERWTVFLDGGAGLLLASEEIPEGGTNFNFTPQAGIGMTFALGDRGRSRLVTALRWHHISNARIRGVDNNPGRDSIMAYIGIAVPW